MNKAERVDVSQLIADCRAGRVDSPVADRLERLIQAAERGTSSTKTPVKRQARSKGLRYQSPKRAAEKPERDAVREHVLNRDRRCIPADRGMPGACQVYGGRDPLEVHEIAARGTHPGSHLDPDLCVAACPYHHDRLTNAYGEELELARELDLRRQPRT